MGINHTLTIDYGYSMLFIHSDDPKRYNNYLVAHPTNRKWLMILVCFGGLTLLIPLITAFFKHLLTGATKYGQNDEMANLRMAVFTSHPYNHLASHGQDLSTRHGGA